MEEKGLTISKARKLKTLIRASFIALFCGLLLLGNFLWEESTDFYKPTYMDEVRYDSNVVYLPWNGYLSSKEDSLEDMVIPIYEEGDSYVFDLKAGRYWGSFGAQGSKINLQIGGKMVIIPSYSEIDVDFDGEVLKLATYKGNTYIGFLSDDVLQYEYLDEYDKTFANVLLVPYGMSVSIPLSDSGSRLTPLLASKLAKEFSYKKISQTEYANKFVQSNLEQSVNYIEALKEFYRDDFYESYKSTRGVSTIVMDLFSEKLTVFNQKREESYYDQLDANLYKALVADSNVEQADALDDFTSLISDELSSEYFENWFKKLVVFGSSDMEFGVMKRLISEAGGKFDKLDLLALRLGAYDDSSSFITTYEAIENLFGFTNDVDLYKQVLSFYNQTFDIFFLNFADLYKTEYFEMKDSLEKELYEQYAVGWRSDETKQSYVSVKIDFLKKLRDFFFDGKINIDDARKIMSYLIESIDYYMPVESDRAAVIGLFEDELDDIGNYWGYINSVEYSKSSLYGSTHKERYEVYLAERKQITGILDVQQDILGSYVASGDTVDDVVAEVEDVFKEVGAFDVYVEDFTDSQKRFIKVAAVLGGYSFDAEYDRDYGYVKNLYAYGELMSEGNVKMDALEEFLVKKLSDVVEQADLDSGDEKETNAQKIAKSIIAKKLVEAGFSTGMNDIEILDPVNAVYRINDVPVEGGSSTTVSFNYHANDGSVENVFVIKNGEGTSLTGLFPLEELKDIVLDEHL